MQIFGKGIDSQCWPICRLWLFAGPSFSGRWEPEVNLFNPSHFIWHRWAEGDEGELFFFRTFTNQKKWPRDGVSLFNCFFSLYFVIALIFWKYFCEGTWAQKACCLENQCQRVLHADNSQITRTDRRRSCRSCFHRNCCCFLCNYCGCCWALHCEHENSRWHCKGRSKRDGESSDAEQ